MIKINPCYLLIAVIALFYQDAYAQNGWCGESKKEDCGDWVVQMNLFGDGSWDSNDCVSYDGCAENAQWNWSNPGVWSQLLLEKSGFCDQGYRLSNTEDFNVSYNARFSNDYGQRRVAIVSWAKTTDNCDWTTNNLYELYLHEQSYGEENNYDSWCTYVGESTTCSGSTYKLYDCGTQIIGRSLRGWRNNPRTSGTTDVDCLWENWRSLGYAPDVYYYFTEVGAEVGPNSGGQFNLTNQDMVRIPTDNSSPDPEPPSSTGLVDGGVYRLTCNWGNKNLHVSNDAPGSNVTVANSNNSAWSQQWILRRDEGSVYRLEARWGGNYLNASGDSNNANVNASKLNQSWSSQRWKLIDLGNNEYRLQSMWGSDMYLTGNNQHSGNVKVHRLDAGCWWSQEWKLTKVNTNARTISDEEKVMATTRTRLGITPKPVDLNVYPNPAHHGWVEVEAPEQADLRVIDIDGKEVMHTSLTGSSSRINTDRFKSGVYLVSVSSPSGTATTKLVVTD